MPRTHTQIKALIAQILQDISMVTFTTAELDQYMKEGLDDLSAYVPYRTRETLTTTASKELTISTIPDLIRIEQLEYKVDQPVKQFHNWTYFENKIVMKIAWTPAANESVYLYCAKRNHLDKDWVAATTYAKGDFAAPTVKNGCRYECTVAGTSHASTQPTWPTTEGTTVTDNTVTWTCRTESPNTLDNVDVHIEDLFANYVAALAAINKARYYIGVNVMAAGNTPQDLQVWGTNKKVDCLRKLQRMVKRAPAYLYSES